MASVVVFSATSIQTKLLSWHPKCPVPLADLRLLKLTHWGFDDQPHTGELIVHQKIASEVLEIFKELYVAHFPIEKMQLIDVYGADDNASMADNNSSGFCYREAVAKPGILSKHSFGLAIDINPLVNPYIKGDLILPKEGKPFVDRRIVAKGMIHPDGICCQVFEKYGWVWGGRWEDRTDFQHFEKDPNIVI